MTAGKVLIDTNIHLLKLFEVTGNSGINKLNTDKLLTLEKLPPSARVITDLVLAELEILITKVIPRKYKFTQKSISLKLHRN